MANQYLLLHLLVPLLGPTKIYAIVFTALSLGRIKPAFIRVSTVEPVLRDHCDGRLTCLERPDIPGNRFHISM